MKQQKQSIISVDEFFYDASFSLVVLSVAAILVAAMVISGG